MDAVTTGIGPALAYTIGIDIGQARDPTAIAVIELRQRQARQGADVVHITRYLERLPLNTPYPRIASRLVEIVQNAGQQAHRDYFDAYGTTPPDDWPYGFEVYIDATGVGRPVVDVLAESGLEIIPVYFTHGDRRNRDGQQITLGKAWLVSRLKTLFQTGRVMLPPKHPEAQAMRQELLDYEIRVDERANDRYGAFRTGAHDDLVTALGLATQDETIIDRIMSRRMLEDYMRERVW